jgi:4-diphosphocytidyl-2-C-methyl-D-erythritol kinase
MVERSYTRVTLALDIIRKIESGSFTGYHELGIIKHKIDLYDVITIEESPQMILECDNPLVPCDQSNICWKAAVLLKERFKIDSQVRIHLEKHIPVMGGLAGGSANAATTLSMLNIFWGLQLSNSQCMDLGRLLGMDVPFYFSSATAFDTEATGFVDPISHGSTFTFVLAIPGFGVSTKDAYYGIDYNEIGKSADRTTQLIHLLRQNKPHEIYALMHNDFEYTVFKKHPHLSELKNQLINAGCKAAMMTGSGSTILGIADDYRHAAEIQSKINCKTIISSSLI